MLSALQYTLLAETSGVRKGLQPLRCQSRERRPRNFHKLKELFIYIINSFCRNVLKQTISYFGNYILYIFFILLTVYVHCDRRVNLYIQAYPCMCTLIHSSICVLNLVLPTGRPDFLRSCPNHTEGWAALTCRGRSSVTIWLIPSTSLVPLYHFKLKQPRNMERY